MSEYVLQRLAVADLQAASGYVTARTLDRIFVTLERLARGEFDGPTTTLRTGALVHSWPCQPLRIYYVRRDGKLVVLRIYHGARKPLER